MNLFRALSVALWSLQASISRLFRFSIWVPFLMVGALQLLLLEILLSFHRPVVMSVALPLVTWVGGQGATHYPFFYLALPSVFARVNIAVAVLASSWSVGAGTLLFARSYGQETAAPYAEARRRYGALVVVAVLEAALSIGIFLVAGGLPRDYHSAAAVRWGARLAPVAVFALVETFLIFTSPWIVLGGRGPFAAIGRSVRTAGRRFLPTFGVVLLMVLLNYPLDYLSQRSDLFYGKFNPELLAWVLVLEIAAAAILGFLLTGAVTRLFLWDREERA